MPPVELRQKPRLYGRRRGRRLRAGRRALMNDLLPRLVLAPGDAPLDPMVLFPFAPEEVWLEVGFGAGEHLAWQARAHPRAGLIGAEVFENGIAALLAEIARDNLVNIRLFADDARLLLARLPARSLGRAFILFPDPWPKERHKKRRIVSRETLDALARALRPGAELRLATDDPDYAVAMAEAASSHPGFVLFAAGTGAWPERPADWPPSRYEEKARAAGREARYFRLKRRP
jgi:tRNA (guanine-N7-)-methyltransferase